MLPVLTKIPTEMREVSVRMLHFYLDLARVAGIDHDVLTAELTSITAAHRVDGAAADWIDWSDYVEVVERFERMVGGLDGVSRVMRKAMPSAYPEMRAFGAVFVHPIPLFEFFMTRFLSTMYRHLTVSRVERLGDTRVRWRQSIPEPYRPSEAFHRASLVMGLVFPCHLDLAEATLNHASITARSAELDLTFGPSPPLTVRGARAASSATPLLAQQLHDAFAKIAEALRAAPGSPGVVVRDETDPNATPAPSGRSDDIRAWADRFALSPRQRDVFSLLVEGRANKDIAATLSCGERNVEFHVSRILRAAGVASRAELLAMVLGSPA